jgi:ligand-binding sensor domain-containing protein
MRSYQKQISLWILLLISTAFVSNAGCDTKEAVAEQKYRVVRNYVDTREAVCLAPDGDTLWIGTLGGGMIRYAYDSVSTYTAVRGLPGNRVTDCRISNSVLFVTTDAGLARFDAKSDRFERIRDGRFLRLASAGQSLFVARDDGTVLTFRGSRVSERRIEMTPSALAGSGDGQFAAGSFDGRVFDSRTGNTERFAEPIIGLAWDNDDLSILTAGNGYRLREGRIETVNSLSGNVAFDVDGRPVSSVGWEDRQVNAVATWKATRIVASDDGVFQVTDKGPRAFAFGGMPCGGRISALAEFDDALWAGSFDNGLCRLKNEKWERFYGPEFLPSDMINDLTADADHLYIATLKGFATLDRSGKFSSSTVEDCRQNPKKKCPWHSSVTSVAVDRGNGAVWMADTGALHRIDGDEWKRYYTREGIASRAVTRVAAWNGNVAVGTGDRGIHLMNGQKFLTLDDQNGLADNWVMDLTYATDGALWIATCTRGVSVYKDGRWGSWRARDGLSDDYTLSVAQIGNAMWIGTLRGLTIVARDGIFHMNVDDGLGGNEVHDILSYKGLVYLATDGGLTAIEEK